MSIKRWYELNRPRDEIVSLLKARLTCSFSLFEISPFLSLTNQEQTFELTVKILSMHCQIMTNVLN